MYFNNSSKKAIYAATSKSVAEFGTTKPAGLVDKIKLIAKQKPKRVVKPRKSLLKKLVAVQRG